VIAALEKLSQMKRADYEPALPEIGAVLALVESERVSRENRSQAKTSERLVRWQCPSCKLTTCGFPSSNDALDRRCYRKVWSEEQHRALECGAQMTVIFDERDESDSGTLEKWDTRLSERIGQ